MSVTGEPTEGDESGKEQEKSVELFPVGLALSELIAEFRDAILVDKLVKIISAEGRVTEAFKHQMAIASTNITEVTESEWQKALGTEEERPLQVRQQILRQVLQIILLLDTYWKIYDSGRQDLVEVLHGEIIELRGGLLDDLNELLHDTTLTHGEYFKSIREKVKGLLAQQFEL